MIICFNCSPETKELLDKLLKTSQYTDYAEAISIAVANQAILQEQISKNGSLVIDEVPSLISQSFNLIKELSIGRSKPQGTTNIKVEDHLVNRSSEIPPIFLLDGLNNSIPSIAHLPADFWTRGQEVPLDRWLFGQYNKLLPAKANCRALAHLLQNDTKGVTLEDAILKIADEAIILGELLSRHDEVNKVSRDDALATAFPCGSEKADKGRVRYANHFIASVNKQGQVSGLLIDLKLINFKAGKIPRLLLTDIGRQFSILRNPILDGEQESPAQKFTKEEVAFLLDHITRNVPVEDFAYRAILIAILEGANTPDHIDRVLQKYVPKDTNRNLSNSFLSSQRSGAISRMADLGLVERVRDGVKVSYSVTDSGKQYMEKVQ
ncbi:MAG: hypothetical protein ABR577_04560 [Pyrinomonadaceae bacterium]